MSICVIRVRAFARVLSIVLLFVFSSTHAASVVYLLDQSNDLPDGVNYLSVTISDSEVIAGAIDFEINVISDSLPEPGSNFGIQSFYFNIDDSLDIAKSNISNIDPDTWSVREARNSGGDFGKFNLALFGKGSSRTDHLTFSIIGVDGDSIESYAIGSLLNPDSGQFFAAHVAGFSDEPYNITSAKFAGSMAAVPLPAAFWFLVSGIGLLGSFCRRVSASR